MRDETMLNYHITIRQNIRIYFAVTRCFNTLYDKMFPVYTPPQRAAINTIKQSGVRNLSSNTKKLSRGLPCNLIPMRNHRPEIDDAITGVI